jgi:N-acyl-D-amino-acid deacylase
MRPDAMLRIGSITKVLTSIAMLRLRDRGQLDLDQTFLSVLTQYHVDTGGDARLANITLRDLLRHSGGWDRTTAGDIPLGAVDLDKISKALNVPRPISSDAVIRYTMQQPLQFAPGTRVAYSNLGFVILGRVIERVSGQSYESYVREQVLAPLGVHAMSIGRGHLSERGPLEVKYYAAAGEQSRQSDFAGEGVVASPYSYDLARFDSGGGWIASGADLTRVLAALDPALQPGFLSADSLTQMFAPPPYASGTQWYGLGIGVGPMSGRYAHDGALPGSSSYLEHVAGGYEIAILTNSRYPGGSIPATDAAARVEQLLANGFEGSAVDLYGQFPSPVMPASGP